MKVCFCFDEDWRDGDAWAWPANQQSLVEAFMYNVPRHRRHAKFSFGSLFLHRLAEALGSSDSAVEQILGDKWVVWSTFAGPELSRYMRNMNIGGMVVDSIMPADVRSMHVALQECDGYLGAIQILFTIPVHWLVFEHRMPRKFRIIDNELRIFYSGFEAEVSDERDFVGFERWRSTGLFSSMKWEDTGLQETIFDPYATLEDGIRAAELEELLSGQFAFALHEVLMRSSDLDPNLTLRLHAAIKAFEGHDTAEQLAHVALSCRRYVELLADCLYPPREEKVNGRDVGASQYRNRLWAYVAENIESRASRDLILVNLRDLGARIDALDANANRGLHSNSNASEINRVLISLLVVSHDLLILAPLPDKISYRPYEDEVARMVRSLLESEDES
jgi:hypothetical protein